MIQSRLYTFDNDHPMFDKSNESRFDESLCPFVDPLSDPLRCSFVSLTNSLKFRHTDYRSTKQELGSDVAGTCKQMKLLSQNVYSPDFRSGGQYDSSALLVEVSCEAVNAELR